MDKKILLAKRLLNQTKISNITQNDIASHLNISQPFVSDILTGKKQLNGILFEKLIDFLGFSKEEKIDLQFLFLEVKTGFSSSNAVIKMLSNILPGTIKDIDNIFILPEKEIYNHIDNYIRYIRNYITSVTHFINNNPAQKRIQKQLTASYNKIKSVYKVLPDDLKNNNTILKILLIADTCNEQVVNQAVVD